MKRSFSCGLVTASLLGMFVHPAEATTCLGRYEGRGLVRIRQRAFVDDVPGGLRETSVASYCLGCHDGAVARAVPCVATGGARALRSVASAPGVGSHPVDLPYPLNSPRFRPLEEARSLVPLSDGRVTCASCHAGNEPAGSALTAPAESARLCLCCHRR